jgi:hypothetical protein
MIYNSGFEALLIAFGIPVVVAVSAIYLLRYVTRRTGCQKMYEEGVVMSNYGIEYLWLFGVSRHSYGEIASVEAVTFTEYLLNLLLFRYGISTMNLPLNPFKKIVVIRFKNPNPIEFFFFTPKNPSNFVRELRERIKF